MTPRGKNPDNTDSPETLQQFSASDPIRPASPEIAEMTPPPSSELGSQTPDTRAPEGTGGITEEDSDGPVDETVATTPHGSVSTSGFAAALALTDRPKQGQIIFERYRVERELGEGGMGSVWLVHHLGLDADRALKLIVSEIAADEQVRARFKREARVMAKLTHPNAVTVHDSKLAKDAAFIEMEYVRGQSLNKIMKPGTPMPIDWVARIVEQLCDVLQTAHDMGIVHRDLKPSNMMLVDGRAPGREFLKVLDFGIAKILTSDGSDGDELRTQTNTFIGTAHYSSPEQIRGANIDARSDLYSTGVILYEFLSGQRPFSGTAQMLICDHLTTPPPPFAMKNPNCQVPAEVERVVLRTLSKDPDDRPQSARELSEEFLHAVKNGTMHGGRGTTEGNARNHWANPDRTEVAPNSYQQTRPTSPRAPSWRDSSRMDALAPNAYDRTEAKSQVEGHEYPGFTMTDKRIPKSKNRRPLIAVSILVPVLLLMIGIVIKFSRRDGNTADTGKGNGGGGIEVNPQPKGLKLSKAAELKMLELARLGYKPDEDEGTNELGWPKALVRNLPELNLSARYYLSDKGLYLPTGYTAEGPPDPDDDWPQFLVRDEDKVRFIRIAGGMLNMGGVDGQTETDLDSKPHNVLLDGFYIQEKEVTNREVRVFDNGLQAQRHLVEWGSLYRQARDKLGSEAEADKYPAGSITHKDAELCAFKYNGLLPTEAQWEWAARSRSKLHNPYVWSWNQKCKDPNGYDKYAFLNRAGQNTWLSAPVGSFPNDSTKQGVFDMAGNVREWCRDVFEPYRPNENGAAERNPAGGSRSTSAPVEFVVRGGGAGSGSAQEAMTILRSKESNECMPGVGFRLVLETPDSPGLTAVKQ